MCDEAPGGAGGNATGVCRASEAVPEDLRALFRCSIEEWLLLADAGTGRLLGYGPALLRNFDSVEQIAALYLESDGEPRLAMQFFEDVGIEKPDDRKLFQATFAGSRRRCSGEAWASQRSPRPVAQSCHGGDTMLAAGFRPWLLQVDPTGSLSEEYGATLLDLYDTPEQVLRLYVEQPPRGDAPGKWSGQFFEDAAIRAEHQGFFEEWLHQANAAGTTAAVAGPEAVLSGGAACLLQGRCAPQVGYEVVD